jgi:light-regulated signal transduction histidine kinase (bacteriophytochrome)
MKKSELEATCRDLRQENKQLNEFRIAVAHALQRPDFCSLENLTRYVEDDIEYLRTENQQLRERIAQMEKEQVHNDWR